MPPWIVTEKPPWLDRSHQIYHDDVIVEFPQSGERISGKHNIYELRNYPAKLSFKVSGVRGAGNLWVSEIVITYDGRPLDALSIMEFRDGRVAHETYYFGDSFEAPE